MKNKSKYYAILKRLRQVGALTHHRNPLGVAQSRKSLLDALITSPGLECIGNVSRQEYYSNMATIGRLVSGIVAMCGEDEYQAIEFRSNTREVVKLDETVDPLQWLLSKGNRLPRVESGFVDSILKEYDFEIDGGGTFYINTSDWNKPLYLDKVGDVHIMYRSDFYMLDSILQNILWVALPYLLYEESFRFTTAKTLKYKNMILEAFSGITANESVMNFDFIVNDAYTDLIKLSNVGQMSKMSLRVQRLEKLKTEFADNYSKSFSRGFYQPLFSSYEYSSYSNLFEQLYKGMVDYIPVIQGRKKNFIPKIKPYYIFDQLDSERNNLKIQEEAVDRILINYYGSNRSLSTYIHQIHPDIKLGLYNLSLHLDLVGAKQLYFENSYLCRVVSIITSKYYRRKPVLVKFLIKELLDGIYHDYKEDGLLMFHQLETLFGYRNSHLLIDEVKDDYLAWFNKGIEKYSDLQSQFIKKWAKEFFESMNYQGKRIGDVYKHNASKFTDFNQLLGDPVAYMTSAGAVDDFKARTTDNRTVGISKNQYFNIFKSQEDYISDLKKKVTPRRNKVIIKREEAIKQRIVINSTLNTFVPLSKLNRFVSTITYGSAVTYFSNSKQQKADHYMRLQDYLLYNKYIENRYLALPLDYSSYDHTITMGFITEVLHQLADYVGYAEEVDELLAEFKQYLKDEVVYFKELEGLPENNQKYKYGMLSGWKITSSVESLGNAIISYGVSRELGEKLVDFETMGDDLILLYDKPKLQRQHQLDFLERICSKYNELGFEMNAPKNSVGYYFLEFLRVTFLPGLVQAYPARILGAISTLKPGRSEQTFGITEFQAVCKKIVKRYGVTSQFFLFAERVAKYYKKSDIRAYGVSYLRSPQMFKIKRIEKVEYKVKVDDIKGLPIYKRYTKILGEDLSDIIARLVEDEIVTHKVVLTKLVPSKKKAPPEKWKVVLISKIFNKFKKDIDRRGLNYKKVHLPEYHLSSVILEWISKQHPTLQAIKERLFLVNQSLFDAGLIYQSEFSRNNKSIVLLDSINQVEDVLRDDKIKVDDSYIPSIIISQVKQSLVANIRQFATSTVLTRDEVRYLNAILKKKYEQEVQTILTMLLAEGAEVINGSSGMPIAYRSD